MRKVNLVGVDLDLVGVEERKVKVALEKGRSVNRSRLRSTTPYPRSILEAYSVD